MNDEELDRAVRSLSRTTEPPVDLWPGIEQAIETRSRSWRLPLGIAAAIAAGALLWSGMPSSEDAQSAQRSFASLSLEVVDSPAQPVDAVDDAGVELEPAERALADAASDLLAAYTQRRRLLDEDLLAVFDDNLAVVDEAIERSRAALRTSPEDEHLRRVLLQAYDHKLELLRVATDVESSQ